MSVSIKVAIRCRPFTIDDKLGVKLNQISEEEGDVELINCDYSTTRFPFTYAWWSAYGYSRHLKGDNIADADAMPLIDQNMAYQSCGLKIKADLMGGNAVVLFAYGLSGSGKTFTVFGPDAIDAPEAWFKHAEPHPLWGIFPRLAYEIFQEKRDGWKISMKYFQNVVDTVRDLMSPSGEEQHYKNGMHKDPDGFMDIEWCETKIISSWNDLRETFMKANARKAIAPTQFNPMSTRGHCIMVLEVEMPDPDNEGMKKRGRVYVCDLAGTEPAGDIVYAQYNKVTFDDGSIEYKFIGSHPDKKKSKELQEQGMKINLSLSEMAQFFMKMAEAVNKKKLTPGMSIPGCNSFFLCKYLKDTMLQARTYLFCAIRPEVEFLKYTFSTLGFAKNASVVKLSPKKATVAASAAERRLMAELEAMKELVAQLQSQSIVAGGSTVDDSARIIADLKAKLEQKQSDLAREVNGESINGEDKRNEEQIALYSKRGISLAAYETESNLPYFINLDEDAFRSNRFMYILRKDITIFGSKGDIQPMSLVVVRDHCAVRTDNENHCVYVKAGKGDTWHNGHLILSETEERVNVYDRIAIGDQLMLLRWPDYEETLDITPMNGADAVEEYHEGLINNRNKDGEGHANYDLEEERKRIREEREKWETEKSKITVQRNEEEFQRAMTAIDNNILDLLPKTKEAKSIVDLFNRTGMNFDVVLEKGKAENMPRMKISVVNKDPKLSILIDPQEFLPKLSILKDEMMKFRNAIDEDREYELPERHDPLFLMFDNDFLLGTATHWPEYLIYNLETSDEEKMQDIKNAVVPYNTVGLLEVMWIPLAGPEEENDGKPVRDIDNDEDVLGKPWTYKLKVRRAADLPVLCEMAYIQYQFLGETFTSEAVQQITYSPSFDYERIHHVHCVTESLLKFLKEPLEISVHMTQHIKPPNDKLNTKNKTVYDSIKSGKPLGYDQENNNILEKSDLEIRFEKLLEQLELKEKENDELKSRINELEIKLKKCEEVHSSTKKNRIETARLTDLVVNSRDAPEDIIDDKYISNIETKNKINSEYSIEKDNTTVDSKLDVDVQ